MKRVFRALGITAGVVAAGLALAIAFGGPGTPPPLASISDPFKSVDFSDLPPLATFQCRGGDTLAYREYKPGGEPAGTVVLVHGSSGNSRSMHPLAKGLARAGYRAYALDMRGHGASGDRGQAKFVGHLEYDVDDFLKQTGIAGKATLVGFSSGGGFALRYAASDRQDNFARYVLLSPFVGYDAPTIRPDGGWASAGVPRIVATLLLNQLGVTAFNHLPVIRFAVNEEGKKVLTSEYSFALAMNFGPPRDYQAAIRALRQPTSVVVGEKDELFFADQFAPLFSSVNALVPVSVVPGLNHIGMTTDPKGIDAVVGAVRSPPREATGSKG